MDIEGGEILALPGMMKLLRHVHPQLLIELHGPEAAQASWNALKETGYRICRMEPQFPQIESFEELDWKSYLAAFPG
jgi:hypothetical protein